MTAISELSKKTVSYFSDEDISGHCLFGSNPMRPLRVKLTNQLVEGYGLDRKMIMHRPRQLSYEELNMFHADGAFDKIVDAAGGMHAHSLRYYFWTSCSRGYQKSVFQCMSSKVF